MTKLDDAIQEALTAEDAEFLARFEEEPTSFQQMFGIFSGPLGWIYVAFIAAAVILGPVGIYTAIKFLNASDIRPLFYWFAATAGILLVLSVVRIVVFMQINTNRLLRELKRLELQVARLAARGQG